MMNRREFTKRLLWLPASIPLGSHAFTAGSLPLRNSSRVLLVALPGLVPGNTTLSLESRPDLDVADDWNDISEVWYRYMDEKVRDIPTTILGLTRHSHFFILKEFSRTGYFDVAHDRSLNRVSIETRWSETQVNDALNLNGRVTGNSNSFPRGDQVLCAWSMVFSGKKYKRVIAGERNAN